LKRALTADALVFALMVTGVHAQERLAAQERDVAPTRSVAEGLRLNVHAGVAHLDGEGAGVRPGLSAGYGSTRWFSVFITYDRVPLNDGTHDFDLEHIDAGVRVNVRGAGASLVPFGLAAYTWRSADYGERLFLGDTLDVRVHGSGLTVGVGAAYHVTPALAVEGSVKRSGGAMDRVDANGFTFRHDEATIGGATLRVNVGVSWWIRGRASSERGR
jgi:hypothetical protein